MSIPTLSYVQQLAAPRPPDQASLASAVLGDPDPAEPFHAGCAVGEGGLNLCEVYADAYGEVPGENTTVKTDAFHGRATAALSARNYELISTGR